MMPFAPALDNRGLGLWAQARLQLRQLGTSCQANGHGLISLVHPRAGKRSCTEAEGGRPGCGEAGEACSCCSQRNGDPRDAPVW